MDTMVTEKRQCLMTNSPDLLMQVGFLMMMVVMLFGAHQIADMWDKRGEK